jgi:excinuclease UvrABC ATPase subunit
LDDGLGLENASFKWNEVEEKPKDKDSIKNPASPSTLSSNDEMDTAGRDVDSMLLAESGDHRFELRDINVRFPEGQLSLITGPTASGKTALLVRRRFSFPISFP